MECGDSDSNSDCESVNNLNFSISITGDEWNRIKPSEKFDKDRIDLRLNDPWTYVINSKIWEAKQLPCAFAFKKQKFYKQSGYPYFEIFGTCNDKLCRQSIHGKCIAPNNDGVEIEISCRNTVGIPHKKKKALKGQVRAEAKKILLIEKPIKFKAAKADELLNNSGGDCPLLQTSAVFSTARQEARDSFIGVNKYPGDTITSLMSIMNDNPSIRRLSTYPFYVWYWTDNQLELWKAASDLGAIISIDASGSFVKCPDIVNNIKCSPIFLYNIVTHLQGKIYSICQSLSSAHDTNSIFLWLFCWLQSGAPKPKEVVVDCSMALLNALSLAFNGFSYDEYLHRCFCILKKKKIDVPFCLIKRDRAHLIKGFCKLKCFENEHWIKKDFYVRVIGFALEIENFNLLEDVITALFVMCMSEWKDKGTICFEKKTLLEELVGNFNYEAKYAIESDEKINENNYEYIFNDSDSHKSSTIRDYIYDLYNKSLGMCCNEKELTDPNSYYLPELSEYLIHLFSQFVAWTNVINKYFNSKSVVSTSSCSECYFKIMRNDYGMTCPISINRFILNHLNILNGMTKLGRASVKQITKSNSMLNDENLGKNQTVTASCKIKIPLKNDSQSNKNAGKDLKDKIIHYKDYCNNCQQNTCQNDCLDSHENVSKLVDSYMQSKEISYTVTHYSSESQKNIFWVGIDKTNLVLWSDAFCSLKPHVYVSGSVIDCFMTYNSEKYWKNISFISTNQTIFILGDYCDNEKPPQWLMYNLNIQFSGLIFLPYVYSKHWCLVVLNIEEKTFMHINPFLGDSYAKRAEKAFLKYLEECKSYKTNNLSEIDWQIVKAPNDRVIQTDGSNCGIYVMFYMSKIAEGKSLQDFQFNPIVYRRCIAENLIIHSKNLKELCLYCTNERNCDVFDCTICGRWFHKSHKNARLNQKHFNKDNVVCKVCEDRKN